VGGVRLRRGHAELEHIHAVGAAEDILARHEIGSNVRVRRVETGVSDAGLDACAGVACRLRVEGVGRDQAVEPVRERRRQLRVRKAKGLPDRIFLDVRNPALASENADLRTIQIDRKRFNRWERETNRAAVSLDERMLIGPRGFGEADEQVLPRRRPAALASSEGSHCSTDNEKRARCREARA
jgi:hypothetical protein